MSSLIAPGTTAQVFCSLYSVAVVIAKRLGSYFFHFFLFDLLRVSLCFAAAAGVVRRSCALVWGDIVKLGQQIRTRCNWCGCDIATMSRKKWIYDSLFVFFFFVRMFISFPLEFGSSFYYCYFVLLCAARLSHLLKRFSHSRFDLMQLMPKKR